MPGGGGGSPSQGVEESIVSGYTGVAGSESSPIPSEGEPFPSNIPPENPSNINEKAFLDSSFLSYLEHVAKGFSSVAKSGVPSSSKNCGLWAKIGECKNGHRHAKRLFCGRQWHEPCREITHRRKLARVLPKAQQMNPMGYWVVRPPNECQRLLRSKKQRAAFTTRAVNAFKAIGYERGLVLKHDFGERSTKYAFHSNVLVDSGFKEPGVLEAEKRKLRRLIYPRWVIEKWGDKLDIWYSYRDTPAKIMHTLNYCTKATFLDYNWDPRLAEGLYRERYIVSWGKWEEPEKWQLPRSEQNLESLVSLEKKQCPECGEPMTWNRRLQPFVLVLAEDPVDLGNGYYRLPPIRPPPAYRNKLLRSPPNTQTGSA